MRNLNGTPTATEEGVLAFGSLPLWFIGGNAGATQAEASAKLLEQTGQVAKVGTQAEYTFTKSAGKHLTEVVKRGENVGQLARPYMKSPLTIQEIMSTGKGIPDAYFKGGMNWRVPSIYRGSQGIWELGINPKTNVIYHFNFTH